MKDILVAAVACVVGLGTFVGLMWLSIFATDYEEGVTDPVARILIHLLLWSFEAIMFGIVAYIIYLVYRQYTDPDVPTSALRKRKELHNPEFE